MANSPHTPEISVTFVTEKEGRQVNLQLPLPGDGVWLAPALIPQGMCVLSWHDAAGRHLRVQVDVAYVKTQLQLVHPPVHDPDDGVSGTYRLKKSKE